jgi:SP family sugar:H+ symporter-like MFS transporter
MSLSLPAYGRFWNWLLAFVTPYMVDAKPGGADLGTHIAFLWGSLNFACFAYVYFLIPETRGLTLEQVDEMFEKHVSPRASAKWTPMESYSEMMRHAEKGDNIHPKQVENTNATEVA